jgi:hypothetical protein
VSEGLFVYIYKVPVQKAHNRKTNLEVPGDNVAESGAVCRVARVDSDLALLARALPGAGRRLRPTLLYAGLAIRNPPKKPKKNPPKKPTKMFFCFVFF